MGGRIVGGPGVRRAVKLGKNRTNWLEGVSSSSCHDLRSGWKNFSKSLPGLHPVVDGVGVVVTRGVRGLRNLGRRPVRIWGSAVYVTPRQLRVLSAEFGGLRTVPSVVWQSCLAVHERGSLLQQMIERLEWVDEEFD